MSLSRAITFKGTYKNRKCVIESREAGLVKEGAIIDSMPLYGSSFASDELWNRLCQ